MNVIKAHAWTSAKHNPPKEEGLYYVLMNYPIPHMEIASYLFNMWVDKDNTVISIVSYDKNRIGEIKNKNV